MDMADLKIGDKVRVIQAPPAVAQMPRETRELFRKCVGQMLKIDVFDDYGHLELNVMDDGS